MHATSSLDKQQPRYQCVRCGNCCRWPGDVNVTRQEVASIAAFLGLPEELFIQQHTRLNSKRSGLSIIDKPNGECLFLEGVNTCRIQEVKPEQCSGFPNVWNFAGWRELCEAVEING
jgi:Fe-S-cluster containining protein